MTKKELETQVAILKTAVKKYKLEADTHRSDLIKLVDAVKSMEATMQQLTTLCALGWETAWNGSNKSEQSDEYNIMVSIYDILQAKLKENKENLDDVEIYTR